jgi:hypothetical protein
VERGKPHCPPTRFGTSAGKPQGNLLGEGVWERGESEVPGCNGRDRGSFPTAKAGPLPRGATVARRLVSSTKSAWKKPPGMAVLRLCNGRLTGDSLAVLRTTQPNLVKASWMPASAGGFVLSLSRMRGKSHVQFFGGDGSVMTRPYPTRVGPPGLTHSNEPPGFPARFNPPAGQPCHEQQS